MSNTMAKSAELNDELSIGGLTAEEKWHFENATIDMSQFMQPVVIGETVRDVPIFTPDQQPCRLTDLWAGRPALIVTGSLTCPTSRTQNPALNDIADTVGETLNIVVLYVIDAHPSGDLCPYTGTDWSTQTNQEEGFIMRQPGNQHERQLRATEYVKTLGLDVPVYVDNMTNDAWTAFGKSPNSAIVVGTNGQCLLYQDWFQPEALIEQLPSLLGG